MYFIKYFGTRYNSKKFESYENARKYLRRLITQVIGKYDDSYSKYGFQIASR